MGQYSLHIDSDVTDDLNKDALIDRKDAAVRYNLVERLSSTGS